MKCERASNRSKVGLFKGEKKVSKRSALMFHFHSTRECIHTFFSTPSSPIPHAIHVFELVYTLEIVQLLFYHYFGFDWYHQSQVWIQWGAPFMSEQFFQLEKQNFQANKICLKGSVFVHILLIKWAWMRTCRNYWTRDSMLCKANNKRK